jgi:hypothetical protein
MTRYTTALDTWHGWYLTDPAEAIRARYAGRAPDPLTVACPLPFGPDHRRAVTTGVWNQREVALRDLGPDAREVRYRQSFMCAGAAHRRKGLARLHLAEVRACNPNALRVALLATEEEVAPYVGRAHAYEAARVVVAERFSQGDTALFDRLCRAA